MPATQRRQRTVRFAGPLSADELAVLRNSRLLGDLALAVEINASQVTLEYEFPATSFADIWEVLCALLPVPRIAFLDRLRHALLAFAEQNERDHALYPANWYIYVEDIYLRYAGLREQRTTRRRKLLWRRYQRRPRA